MGIETDYEFKSDGCSRWFEGNWGQCCYVHDKTYWIGGTYWERLKSDFGLARCVYKTKRLPLRTFKDLMSYNNWVMAIPRWIIAPLMFIGVQIGGMGILPTPYRWGFGHKWPKSNPYK